MMKRTNLDTFTQLKVKRASDFARIVSGITNGQTAWAVNIRTATSRAMMALHVDIYALKFARNKQT